MWRPSDQTSTLDYLITVFPSPPYGPDELITQNSSALFVDNTTLYNITISLNTCPAEINNTFIFGKFNYVHQQVY